MEEPSYLEILNKMDTETKVQLAFALLREVLEIKKNQLALKVEGLKRQEEILEGHLKLVEAKKQQFMPEYLRLTKIINALDYAADNIKSKLAEVRDQLRIANDQFNRYISRLEKALQNA